MRISQLLCRVMVFMSPRWGWIPFVLFVLVHTTPMGLKGIGCVSRQSYFLITKNVTSNLCAYPSSVGAKCIKPAGAKCIKLRRSVMSQAPSGRRVLRNLNVNNLPKDVQINMG